MQKVLDQNNELSVFGNKVKKATKIFVESINTLIAVYRSPIFGFMDDTDNLDEAFWTDPYVLGYCTGVLGVIPQFTMFAELSVQERGEAMINAFRTITPRHADTALDRMAQFHLANDPIFMRGAENAVKTVCYTFGMNPNNVDSDVQCAERLAREEGDILEGKPTTPREIRACASGWLQTNLFHNIVQERLQLIDKP